MKGHFAVRLSALAEIVGAVRYKSFVIEPPPIASGEPSVQPPRPACWSWTPEAIGHQPATEWQVLRNWHHGRCAMCGDRPRRLVEDHDHATGLTRGFLCQSCNILEGYGNEHLGFALYRTRPPAAILGMSLIYTRWSTQREKLRPPFELTGGGSCSLLVSAAIHAGYDEQDADAKARQWASVPASAEHLDAARHWREHAVGADRILLDILGQPYAWTPGQDWALAQLRGHINRGELRVAQFDLSDARPDEEVELALYRLLGDDSRPRVRADGSAHLRFDSSRRVEVRDPGNLTGNPEEAELAALGPFKLELGRVNPSRVLYHLRSLNAVARWPQNRGWLFILLTWPQSEPLRVAADDVLPGVELIANYLHMSEHEEA